MEQQLTDKEIEKLQNLCFSNPAKACAVAQVIMDTLQIVSCSTYASIAGKAKRTINYQADKLIGVEIDERKYISINQ